MTRNSKHIKGDQAELIASEHFIKQGCYVFKNISQHGPADMAIMDKDGNIFLIDVKAVSLRSKNGWKVTRSESSEQQRRGIQLLYVDLATRKVYDVLPEKAKYFKNNIIQIKEYIND